MEFNLITNLESCFNLVRDNVNLPLVYYSHIPSALISLFIGTIILIKNRTLLGKILFSISVVFSIWVMFSLVTWTSYNSVYYMFVWSFFGILTSLLFILTAYFSYVYLFKKDVNIWTKWLFLIPLIPIFLLTPTTHNLPSFDGVWCLANEGSYFTTYYYAFGVLALLLAPILLFKKFCQTKDKIERREDFIFIIGIELFILMFFFTGFLASYLADIGAVSSYNYELYGLFGMVIFMAFLAYLIVKFKAFDIKLIGAQALVWALVIMVGSEFMFVRGLSMTIQVLVGITLVISSILGLVLVRSVKKEVSLRESLEIANRNQQSLIHFVSHQLKGFFTKSKMIFSGFLEGDFGETSPTGLEMAKTGLQSDNNAVAMIQDILGASNLKEGTTQYSFKNVSLNDLIQKVCGLYTDQMEKKGLKFEVQITTTPITAFVDETQIVQVFKNLVDNAIKYSPSGTVKATLGIDPNGLKALFEIKDTGIGLTDSDKNRLFTEGGKGEESLKYNTDSAGYGLYIVKKIVETHKGKIWAESEGRGKGSKFCVELPIVQKV